MTTLTTVLFDLDGTLTDPYDGISRSFAQAMIALGRPLPDDHDYRPYIGPPMRTVFAMLCGDDPALQDRGIAAYRARYADVGLFENVVYDGVPAMLERVGRSFRLFVCTSKPHVYAERILRHFGLDGAFAGIYGAELDGTRGNKAELLAWLLEREAIEPRAAALIGDRSYDAVAARSNGVAFAGALWGHGSFDELREAGCTRTFALPGDVTADALRAPSVR